MQTGYGGDFRAFPSSLEGAAWRDHKVFRNETFRVGKIDSVNPALIRHLIEKRNASGIGVHYISNVG
jgi:hypothetical protein